MDTEKAKELLGEEALHLTEEDLLGIMKQATAFSDLILDRIERGTTIKINKKTNENEVIN